MVTAAAELAVLLFVGTLQAQDTPIPDVPANLPPAARQILVEMRRVVVDTVDAHNGRVAKFTDRCGPGKIRRDDHQLYSECENAFKALSLEQQRVVADKKRLGDQIAVVAAAARCAPQAAQIEKDKEAIQRLRRTHEMGIRELEEWTGRRREAESLFVVATIDLTLSRTAAYLTKRQAAANAYKGWVTRYQRQLRAGGVPDDALRARITRAERDFERASAEAASGRALSHGLDAKTLFDHAKVQFSVVAKIQGDADTSIKASLEDPELGRFLDANVDASAALRSIADLYSISTELAKYSPHYAYASFLADNAFNATQWATSLARILQQESVSSQMYQAFASLQEQLDRSRKALAACRAGVGAGP